jgi:hypothetical protein
MKDNRSILLLVLALCLAGTWIFHIYDKSKYADVQQFLPKIDSVAAAPGLNDSVKQLYQSAVVQLEDAKTGKDSLNRELQQKVNEIDTLRIEINRMLSETNLTKEDLRSALEKIQNLQQKINQLYKSGAPGAPPANQTAQTSSANNQAKNVSPKNNGANIAVADVQLLASDIGLQAIRKPAAEVTGADGDNPEQFAISFQVKNATAAEGPASIYMVLKDPEGNIVQDDQWIAGMFQSKADGFIKYSRKINFDFSKGDVKKLNTTIPVNKISKGSYQLHLYQNGQRIGKADVVLN